MVKQVSELSIYGFIWRGSLPKEVWPVDANQIVSAPVYGLFPGVLAHFEDVEDGAEREHVDFVRVVVPVFSDLGCHVGATTAKAIRDTAWLVGRSEAPIDYLEVEVGIEAHVLWLEVTMAELIVFHVLNSIEKLLGNMPNLIVGE